MHRSLPPAVAAMLMAAAGCSEDAAKMKAAPAVGPGDKTPTAKGDAVPNPGAVPGNKYTDQSKGEDESKTSGNR